ncbi:unnamed protein product [Ilex paraguariensis]|uniref:FIP1[V]-like protein n=1 Tax=Ilex paraguariensis TaxID=185542 RepID=A0ABC8THH1_9AQUA
MDDLHIKRRKDETQSRRDNAEKDVLHIHTENSSRRKRERDDVLDQRKRDDQARFRDDDQHQARHKEEGFFQRERGERQREHDEWHRLKQSHEESLSKRERDGGRGDLRSGRNTEDKAWAANSRAKDDYKGSDREYLKDAGRHVEQLKRRDRVENESFSMHRGREDAYTRGNQLTNDGKRARHERASSRNDRAVNASDNHRVHEKRQKENIRKGRELEDGDHISLTPSKRNQEEHNGQISETVSLKGRVEQGSGEHDIRMHHQSSRKHREDVSSDDELQDSRRGRSKMERWTSHKERDFSISSKSSSLKVKEIDTHNKSSLDRKLPDESSKKVENADSQHPLASEKDASDPVNKNADVNPMEDRHLDTVAKLKKRSERFKLPMPSEKEAMAIKKMESEPLPSGQSEAHADSEVKPERPARKRRWTSN